jgi:hypothetical protein
MLALRERRMKVTQAVPQKLQNRRNHRNHWLFAPVLHEKHLDSWFNDASHDAWDAAFVQADMRKAKEKALYKKKGSYPEGMYL